ncbi:MAG: hypothetical protein AB7I19_06565 [Planctomycetota bacterium]
MSHFSFVAVLGAAWLTFSPVVAQDLGGVRQPPGAPTPTTGRNDWVEAPELDLGTHLEGEVARGSWRFKNPTAAPQQIKSFQPSCACSKAVIRLGDRSYRVENQPRPNTIYRITTGEGGAEVKEMVEVVPIAPHEEGSVDVEIDLHNVSGAKEATITVHTSDENNRLLMLKARAVATQFFRISPPEVSLNKMRWDEKKEFEVRINSPLQKDFSITGHDPLPDRMEISYTKEMVGEEAWWVVKGSYGPNVDPKAGGGVINLRTDVQGKSVQVRVSAFVEGPLTITPGSFVPLGRISATEGLTREIEITPNSDFDLQAESIEVKNLSVEDKFVAVDSHKDGKVLKIRIVVQPGAPKRLLRGDVTVKLNHPSLPIQEFQFNGFVR